MKQNQKILFGGESRKPHKEMRFGGESRKPHKEMRFGGESRKPHKEMRFGAAGLGPVKDAVERLKGYSELGLRACEIAFTYGAYIKKEKDMEKIRKASEKFNIKLSIHAPYWINLNSKELEKIEKSKKRILRSCEVGEKLGAKNIVFHPGYYGGMDKERTYENIKNTIIEMKKEIKKNKWNVRLCPETTGKVNVFGSIDEIFRLVKDTNCGFCLDFAHIEARDKGVDWEKLKSSFKSKEWHCHFSGIEYGEKGEKRHKKTSVDKWKEVLKELPKDKRITIINESPFPVKDAAEGLRLSKNYKV